MNGCQKNRRGMTLLEILIALSLMTVLLGFVWGMVSLFSSDYLSGEKRINRAQLVRSVSQMLSDDLGAAIQDPIHSSKTGGNETVFIRRFGLHGDETSLQIDVVEPNLLVETATMTENRAAAATSTKPARPQVPELKTVYYEFVPPNALQNSISDTPPYAGSLNTPSNRGAAELVRKYGLSRKELSYESPDPELPEPKDSSGIAGSLSETGNTIDTSDSNQLLKSAQRTQAEPEPYLTAPQITMAIDDGTLWMPEVVDCRFRYYDGSRWYASWDSIKRNGLPAAIEVDIKLLPLDDVDELRTSPILQRLIYPPNRFDTRNATSKPTVYSTNSLTLEDAADLLKLSPIMTRRITTFLPITPLSQHRTLARRKPLPATRGTVGAETGTGAGSGLTARGGIIGGRGLTEGSTSPLFGTGTGFSTENSGVFGDITSPVQVNNPSPFAQVDTLLSGFDTQLTPPQAEGFVPSQTGSSIPTETSTSSGKTGVQQGWLRGNR